MKSILSALTMSLLTASVGMAQKIHCGESPWNYRVEFVDFTEKSAFIDTDVASATYYIGKVLEKELGANVISSGGLELELPTKGTACETALGVVVNCQVPVAKAKLLSKYFVLKDGSNPIAPIWEKIELNEEVEIHNLDVQTGLRSGSQPGQTLSIVFKLTGVMNFRGNPIELYMHTGLNCTKK